jgi:hypothetical protein
MNMSSGWTARLVVPALALVLGGCLNGGGEEAAPEPPSPNPPQAVNTPPTANAGADQVVAPGATVNLDGSASSDSNGTIATFAWTQTAGSAVTLASAGTASPSFTAPTAAGTLTFQLTVTDNGGASHSDTITVTVNAIPVASAGADQTVSAGAAVTLTGSATDADGTIASYAWAQTSGPTVTLTNANSATASFTAPNTAATLVFSLSAIDDRGANHVDSVTVTVTAIVNPPAGPAIARHPNNPIALEHGSAMMFVAASGNDLTYEWRSSSGAVVKSGPEPFLMITSLNMSQNDDCYYVVISNVSGVATSNEGCLTVEEIDWTFDASDDDQNDDWAYASGYGNGLFAIAQHVIGPFTGVAGFTGAPVRLGFPLDSGPPDECFIGSYGGVTIDGVIMTTPGPLPLGHHVITEAWDNCYDNTDDTDRENGSYMVEYDFPVTWGIGTVTMHISRDYFNGTVHATIVDASTSLGRSEQIEIDLTDDFSMGDMKASSNDSISVDRRYTSDNLKVDDAYVDFTAVLSIYDANGYAGGVSGSSGGFHLHQNFGQGDEEIEEFTSTGYVDVSHSSYHLARLEPSGAQRGWSLEPVPEEECPEPIDACVEPPTP